MRAKRFIITADTARLVRDLDDEQAAQLLRAICMYAAEDRNTDFLENSLIGRLWQRIRSSMGRQNATGATESATEGEEEENPYQDTINGILSAAELLRASGALTAEHAALKEAGLHRARLMLAIAVAELCE